MGDSTSHTSKEPVTVKQPAAGELNVTVDNFPIQDHMSNIPHFSPLPHNTLVEVWIPVSGNKLHMVSFVVSTPAAGRIEFFERTPPAADAQIMRLEFNLRQSVPFGLNTDLDFGWNHRLVVRWIADAAAPIAYITVIGHEHTPAAFPP